MIMTNIAPPIPADLQKTAFLLDVDGTIVDLAATPREVFVPHSLRETLERLWQRTGGAVAFVSGRPISELDLLFAPLALPAIGGHGAEFRIVADQAAQPPRLPPLDPEIKRQFAAVAQSGPGIILEDKGYSLALHYRLAPEKEQLVREAAMKIAAAIGEAVELLPGKLVVEVKQPGVNKAIAVRELMTYPPFAGRTPIFIGDDVTDLSVFAILPDLAGTGASVGRVVPGIEWYFERPTDVRQWLEQISRDHAFAVS